MAINDVFIITFWVDSMLSNYGDITAIQYHYLSYFNLRLQSHHTTIFANVLVNLILSVLIRIIERPQ